VPGTVLEVLVNDNQDVKAGDVLVRLDSRDYDVALVLARAAAEAARGDLQNATASIPLTDESTRSLLQEADASLAAIGHAQEGSEHDLEQKRSDLAAKQAAVEAARASQQAAQSDFDRAKLDRERTLELYRRELVARQDLDPVQEARAFQRLIDEGGLTRKGVAERLSIAQKRVPVGGRSARISS